VNENPREILISILETSLEVQQSIDARQRRAMHTRFQGNAIVTLPLILPQRSGSQAGSIRKLHIPHGKGLAIARMLSRGGMVGDRRLAR
jgi:hypothetical protein